MSRFKTIKQYIKPIYHRYLLYKNLRPYNNYQLKYHCIFIHIPKTAGTSILNQLSNGEQVRRDHSIWNEYRKRSPHFFKYFFKFSFVRNPWDRAVSVYFYIKQSDDAKTIFDNVPLRELAIDKLDTFENYVMNFLNKDVIWTHVLFMPQWFFITDEFGKLQVDYLGKYENLDEDFELIKNKIGIQAPSLKKINTSKRNKYKDYYNENTYRKIAELYSRDIELFNYKF